jgi:membrane protease YdiL (CAAX protease family)
VLAIGLVWLALQATLPYAFGLQREAEGDQEAALTAEQAETILLAAAVANFATVIIGGVALAVAVKADVDDLGFGLKHLRDDIRLGVHAAFAVIVPVYIVQAILSQWVSGRHPIEEVIRDNPEPMVIAISALTAVIAAPLGEEFFFRVLFQGWLERFWPVSRPIVELTAVDTTMVDDRSAPPTTDHGPLTTDSSTIRLPPILISAAFFSLLHLGWPAGPVRPDPIPLFLLSLMLGYVYQRTHRIWPSLIVHFCLNGMSILVLAASAITKSP